MNKLSPSSQFALVKLQNRLLKNPQEAHQLAVESKRDYLLLLEEKRRLQEEVMELKIKLKSTSPQLFPLPKKRGQN